MIGTVWAVAWRIVATLWSLSCLAVVAAVACAAVREARQRRADVRHARRTGVALSWPIPESEDVWTPAEIERRHMALWELEVGESA